MRWFLTPLVWIFIVPMVFVHEGYETIQDWIDWRTNGRWLDPRVRRKFATLDESGMCYYIVSVERRNGRRVHGLNVTPTRFGLRVQGAIGPSIRWKDVANIESDGDQGRHPATEFRPLPE